MSHNIFLSGQIIAKIFVQRSSYRNRQNKINQGNLGNVILLTKTQPNRIQPYLLKNLNPKS